MLMMFSNDVLVTCNYGGGVSKVNKNAPKKKQLDPLIIMAAILGNKINLTFVVP